MDYKSISFTLHSNDSIVEFDLKENMVLEEKGFIMKMTTFLELVGHGNFKKIIFTNVSTFFTISKSCQNYARRCIIDAMKGHGIEYIYFEIPKNTDIQLNIIEKYGVTAIADKNEIIKNYMTNGSQLN